MAYQAQAPPPYQAPYPGYSASGAAMPGTVIMPAYAQGGVHPQQVVYVYKDDYDPNNPNSRRSQQKAA